ncbi:MAG: DMT family transporter [Alcaligenaceae bacterium]|nr:DMT family transporter [Alcaligenaceae bacterium]
MKNLLFFLTLFFITCLATGGIFVKLSELGPVTTGFYRVLFSIPMLYPLLRMEKNFSLSIKDKVVIFIAGMFLAGDLILWNISFHYTTVANANLLANLVPFTIIPSAYFFYKEKVSRNFLFSLIVTLIGLIILINGKVNPSQSNLYGDMLAFATSIFYAAFLLIVYKVRRQASAIQIMYYSGYGAMVILLISSIVMEGVTYPTNFQTLWPLLGLAVFSQILGQGGLSYVLGKISVNLAAVLVLTQPVISAILSYFIFHETLSIQEMLGLFIVLMGIFLVKKEH